MDGDERACQNCIFWNRLERPWMREPERYGDCKWHAPPLIEAMLQKILRLSGDEEMEVDATNENYVCSQFTREK